MGAGAVILTCEFLVIVEIVKLRMGVFEQTVVSLFPPFSGMIVLKVIYPPQEPLQAAAQR